MKVAGNKALLIISIVAVLTIFAAPASAAWPLQAEWIPALGPNWTNITDPSDQQSAYLDCVVDTMQPLSRQAASYWFFDGIYMYFRMILDGDPLRYQGITAAGMKPFGWAVLIESTGDMYPDYAIGINGTGSSDTISSMYNITQDFTMDGATGWTQSATTPVLNGGFWYLLNGMVRSGVSGGNTNGTPDYYLDIMVPLTWLSRMANTTPPAAVTSSTPIKIAFGTDASGQNIGKDLVGQSSLIDIGSYFTSVASRDSWRRIRAALRWKAHKYGKPRHLVQRRNAYRIRFRLAGFDTNTPIYRLYSGQNRRAYRHTIRYPIAWSAYYDRWSSHPFRAYGPYRPLHLPGSIQSM